MFSYCLSDCYLTVKEAASSGWTYRCPCCCHNQEISFKSLPSRLIRKARDNWTVCFQRQDGARRMLHKEPEIEKRLLDSDSPSAKHKSV